MTTETQRNATEVSVQLSSCTADDVETVFRVLADRFVSERESAQLHRRAGGGQPDVWVSQFDIAHARSQPQPTALKGTVSAEIQGAPQAVARLRESLQHAFALHEEQSASGDQELDTWLRLESRTS